MFKNCQKKNGQNEIIVEISWEWCDEKWWRHHSIFRKHRFWNFWEISRSWGIVLKIEHQQMTSTHQNSSIMTGEKMNSSNMKKFEKKTSAFKNKWNYQFHAFREIKITDNSKINNKIENIKILESCIQNTFIENSKEIKHILKMLLKTQKWMYSSRIFASENGTSNYQNIPFYDTFLDWFLGFS